MFKRVVIILLTAAFILPFSFSKVKATEHEYDWSNISIPYFQRAAYGYWMDTLGQSYITRSISTQEAALIGLNLDLGELLDGYTISIPASTITGNIADPSVQSNTYACYITESDRYSGSYSGSSSAGSQSGTITGSSQAHCVFRTGSNVATIEAPSGSSTASGTISGDVTSSLYSYFRTYFEDNSILGDYTPPAAATLSNTLVGTTSTTYTFAFMSNKNITLSRDVIMYGSASKDDIVITGVRNRQEYGYYFTVIEYSMRSGATGNPRFTPVFAATSGLDVIPIYLGDKSKIPADMYRTIYNDQYLESLSSIQQIIDSFKSQSHEDMTQLDSDLNSFKSQSHQDFENLSTRLQLTSQTTATQQANQALADAGSGIELQAQTFTSTVGDLEALESDYSDMFNDNIQAIVTDESGLNSRPGYIRAARWVKSQFNFLTSNNAFGDLIVFSLTAGLTILILGRESDE